MLSSSAKAWTPARLVIVDGLERRTVGCSHRPRPLAGGFHGLADCSPHRCIRSFSG